jgi:nitrogen regulatory protein PII
MAFLPKVEISVWVADQRAGDVAEKITRAARTGRIGDGKVFILDVAWPGAMEF